MWLRKLSLKKQLILFLFLTIVLLLTMQIYSYFRSEYIIQKNAEIYTHNIMTQVSNNVNTVLERIKKVSLSIVSNTYIHKFLQEENPQQKAEIDDYITKFLHPMLNANEDISSILLVDETERFFRYTYNEEHIPDVVIYKKLVERYSINTPDNNERFFTSIIPFGQDIYYCYVQPIFIFDDSSSRKKLGNSIIIINAEHWKAYFDDILFAPDYDLLVVDENNQLVVSYGTNPPPQLDIPFITNQLSSVNDLVTTVYDEQKIILTHQYIKETNWQIISLVFSDTLFESLRASTFFQLTLGIGLFFILLIIGITIIHNFSKPISEVLGTIKMIGEGKTKKKIHVTSNNEIKIIADSINNMMDSINTMQSRVFKTQRDLYEMELKKKHSEIQYKQAEISALQSHINPHFLYNTLDCIKSIGLVYDIDEIVNISTAMSDIFRYSIKGKEFVTIQQEIECVENYLKIMSIRFMERFNYTMNIEEKILEYKVIKMILQPIVENSIFHGLEPKRGIGHLKIKGYVENDMIKFTINDDGIGMTAETLKELIDYIDLYNLSDEMYMENQNGLGIANINKRIKTHFGDDYGIRITSRKDEGTTVTILLPKFI